MGSDLKGVQPIRNFGYLSDAQRDELAADFDTEARMEDFDGEVDNAMRDQFINRLSIDPSQLEEAYFDISVDLEAGEYTVHGIYDSTYGTYGVRIHDKLDVPELPITLPLPDLFYKVVDGTVEYGEPLTGDETEEYGSLAKKMPSNFGAGLSSDEMGRLNQLGKKRSASRPGSRVGGEAEFNEKIANYFRNEDMVELGSPTTEVNQEKFEPLVGTVLAEPDSSGYSNDVLPGGKEFAKYTGSHGVYTAYQYYVQGMTVIAVDGTDGPFIYMGRKLAEKLGMI